MTRSPLERAGEERGTALIAALLLISVLGTITLLITDQRRRIATGTVTERGEMHAFYAAEGGIEHARHALAGDPEWNGDELRIGRCTVTVTVRRIRPEGWEVRSRASCRVRGAPVVATLTRRL